MNRKNRALDREQIDCYEHVNKYGTYNVQQTADTDNFFPEIAQGLPSRLALCKNRKQKNYYTSEKLESINNAKNSKHF